jgi:hypothetical protein
MSCTTAGCEAGVCVQTHISNCQQEVCRTPGFWGTHADQDATKHCSQDITAAVIEAAGGHLTICGHTIDNTNVGNAMSAIEALCVQVRGTQTLQLIRQLTAASLNCVVSGDPADCTGSSIASLFTDCNTCSPSSNTIGGCIAALDCFNNGGTFSNGTCTPGGDTNCHNQPLPLDTLDLPNNSVGAGSCFGQQGAAGSSDECSAATGSSCTVLSCP